MSAETTERFSNRVADYLKARPSYPPEVITALRERLGLKSDWAVADIGAGTGISTKLFVNNGNTVFAVEPNAAMRDAAIAFVGPCDNVEFIDGTAEHTKLADRSVRLVVAAQAFHWFDRHAFRRECTRILRPGGYVALLWNDRKTSGCTFLERYENLLEQFGTDYVSVNHRNVGDDGVAAFFAPMPFAVARFPSAQRFDYDGLRARLLSSSYAPPIDDARSVSMLVALRRLFDETHQNGTVEMTYETQLYWGHLS